METLMKIKINIQTVSDIITNSSSEVFCTIKGRDIEMIKELVFLLLPNKSSDLGPTADYNEDDNCIEVNIPYGVEGLSNLLKFGLEAYLDKYLGGHYHIEYEW